MLTSKHKSGLAYASSTLPTQKSDATNTSPSHLLKHPPGTPNLKPPKNRIFMTNS